MKKEAMTIILASFLGVAFGVCFGKTQIIKADNTKWRLVWQDEFNGNNLDLSKWNYQLGTGTDVNLTDWGNNEKEYYKNENVTVKNGELVITAKRENYNGKPYTSGRINTKNKFAVTYGKIEAAITMPEGKGLWPAFWMLSNNEKYGTWASSGEIDIMEARGRVPEKIDGTIHYGGTWPNNQYDSSSYTFPQNNNITGKHIYSIEWEKNELRWYVDGNFYKKTSKWNSEGGSYPAPFDQDFYILLNLAVGGNYDGNVEPDLLVKMPAEMKIDYVRVYKEDNESNNHEDKEDNNKNLVSNSSFTNGLNNWGVWSQNPKDVIYSVIDGKAVLDIKYPGDLNEWGGMLTWAHQLYQDGIELEKGKKYELSFEGSSSLGRPIIVEIGGKNYPQQQMYFKLDPISRTYNTSFTATNSSKIKLNFLLGNISYDNLNTPVPEHKVYIDDVNIMLS